MNFRGNFFIKLCVNKFDVLLTLITTSLSILSLVWPFSIVLWKQFDVLLTLITTSLSGHYLWFCENYFNLLIYLSGKFSKQKQAYHDFVHIQDSLYWGSMRLSTTTLWNFLAASLTYIGWIMENHIMTINKTKERNIKNSM